jgi:hypothetical protein
MSKTNEQIIEQLRATIERAAPTPDQITGIGAVRNAVQKQYEQLGFDVMTWAALFIDDTRAAHPQLDSGCVFRVAAEALVRVAAMVVRSTRQQEGSELDSGRFALVSFAIADSMLEIPWARDEDPIQLAPGQLRKAIEQDSEMTAERYGPELSSHLNALPARLKHYVFDLEQRADPAGDVRRAFVAEEKAMALEALVQEHEATIAELRKPVAVEPNPDVERIRTACWLTETASWGAVELLLSAYDTLAQNHARAVNAREMGAAEMRGLREQLDQERSHHVCATARSVTPSRLAARPVFGILRDSIGGLGAGQKTRRGTPGTAEAWPRTWRTCAPHPRRRPDQGASVPGALRTAYCTRPTNAVSIAIATTAGTVTPVDVSMSHTTIVPRAPVTMPAVTLRWIGLLCSVTIELLLEHLGVDEKRRDVALEVVQRIPQSHHLEL